MIGRIGPLQQTPQIDPASSTPGRGNAREFGSVLEKAIAQVEQSRQTANAQVERLLSGKPEELHSVVLNTQKAQLEFELFLEVRNKVVQAYQEIMRMQV
jgi:flagellar hook-basal body complex protein FliE